MNLSEMDRQATCSVQSTRAEGTFEVFRFLVLDQN